MKYAPLILALLASATSPAWSAAGPSAPAAAASAATGCGKLVKPHDHAAERGTGSSLSKSARDGCGAPAKDPAAKAKAAPLHDHGKMHKQQ
jgi:hypothetical protein